MLRRISIAYRRHLNAFPSYNYSLASLQFTRACHDNPTAPNFGHPLEVLDRLKLNTPPNGLTLTEISGVIHDLQQTHTQNPCELSIIESHRSFSILCDSLKDTTISISESGSLVALLKSVLEIGLSTNHPLTRSILTRIWYQATTLTLDDIFQLDKLIRSSYNEHDPNIMHQKLLMILPMVYQVNYLEELDYEDVDALCNSLDFVANNYNQISRRAISGIVTSLRLNGQYMHLEHAMQIITSLSRLPYIISHIDPLLKKCSDIFANEPLTKAQAVHLLNIVDQFNAKKSFASVAFLQTCVDSLIRNDCEWPLLCSVHKQLKKLSFWSADLESFIYSKLVDAPNSLPVEELIELIGNLKEITEAPLNWRNVLSTSTENVELSNLVKEGMDWPGIALALAKSGRYDTKLIDKILRSDLTKKFKSDYIQSYHELQKIWGFKAFQPYEKMLFETVGRNKVLVAVPVKSDCYFHYVLKMNVKTGEFETFDDNELENRNLTVRDIHCGAGEKLIGIMSDEVSPYWRNTLMSADIVVVPVHLSNWSRLPQHMKVVDLFSRINKHIELFDEMRGMKSSRKR